MGSAVTFNRPPAGGPPQASHAEEAVPLCPVTSPILSRPCCAHAAEQCVQNCLPWLLSSWNSDGRHTPIASRRFRDHLVEDAAAAVIRSIVGATVSEIGNAIDVLVDCPAWQGPHCRSNRRRDYLVTARDRGIELTAAIEPGPAATEIDAGRRGRRIDNDRSLRRRYYRVLPALWRLIDAILVIIRVSGDRDCRRRWELSLARPEGRVLPVGSAPRPWRPAASRQQVNPDAGKDYLSIIVPLHHDGVTGLDAQRISFETAVATP